MGTILIADDHAANRQYLQTLLGYTGHRVLAACDGAEALQLALDEHPDLAIIDLLMPEMDGYEFARRLRSDPTIAKTPVIFLSAAYGSQEALPLSKACGVYEFLPKPVRPGRLLQVVAYALGLPMPKIPVIPPDFEREHRRLLTAKLVKNTTELELANQKLTALARDTDERRQHAEAVATELRRAKAALEAANAELSRSNDELRQFAFVASHDLQEPLRSITSFCNLLKEEYRGRLTAEADNYIDRIVNGAKRMKALVTDLLGYSRVSRDEQNPLTEVDFEDVAADALANLQSSIRDSGAKVSFGEMPTVIGDRVQLVQLLQNLIGNAILYRSAEPPRIHIEARREDGFWEFSVQDNGIGIAPEHHQQIFEIFKRLHARDKYAGTGIGLAVCKKIVLRHGGEIGVDSQLGAGSVFRFTIHVPAEVADNESYRLVAASV